MMKTKAIHEMTEEEVKKYAFELEKENEGFNDEYTNGYNKAIEEINTNRTTIRQQFVMEAMSLAYNITLQKMAISDSEAIAQRSIELADACIKAEEESRK